MPKNPNIKIGSSNFAKGMGVIDKSLKSTEKAWKSFKASLAEGNPTASVATLVTAFQGLKVAGGVVVGAVKKVAEGMADLAKGGMKANDEFRRMNLLIGSKTKTDSLLGTIDALEDMSSTSGDELSSFAQKLLTAGRSAEDVEKILTATVDITNTSGRSFSEVGSAIENAFNGKTKQIEKILPSMKGVEKGAWQTGEAIDQITESLHDASVEIASGSFSNSLSTIGNQWGRIKENIGSTIVANIESTGVLQTISTWLEKIETNTKKNADEAEEEKLRQFILSGDETSIASGMKQGRWTAETIARIAKEVIDADPTKAQGSWNDNRWVAQAREIYQSEVVGEMSGTWASILESYTKIAEADAKREETRQTLLNAIVDKTLGLDEIYNIAQWNKLTDVMSAVDEARKAEGNKAEAERQRTIDDYLSNFEATIDWANKSMTTIGKTVSMEEDAYETLLKSRSSAVELGLDEQVGIIDEILSKLGDFSEGFVSAVNGIVSPSEMARNESLTDGSDWENIILTAIKSGAYTLEEGLAKAVEKGIDTSKYASEIEKYYSGKAPVGVQYTPTARKGSVAYGYEAYDEGDVAMKARYYKIANAFSVVSDKVSSVLSGLGESFSDVTSLFQDPVVYSLKEILKGFMDVLRPMVDQLMAPLNDMLTLIGRQLADTLQPILQAVAPVMETIVTLLGAFFTPIIERIGKVMKFIAPIIEWCADALKEMVKFVVKVTDTFQWVSDWMQYTFDSLIYNMQKLHVPVPFGNDWYPFGKGSGKAPSKPTSLTDRWASTDAMFSNSSVTVSTSQASSATSATYQGGNQVHMEIFIEGNVIGDEGYGELARIIRSELQELDYYNV